MPVATQPGEENAFQAIRRLLDGRQPPEAIFVAAARFVRGALRAAKAQGRQIPGELLIAAIEMLLARLDGEQVEAPLHVRATLRLRASTAGRAVL